MNREFDLIIYGATGFTGRLAVEYIDNNYSDLKWAIAGRNSEKLTEISNSTMSKPPIFVARSDDAETLSDIVRKTRVIASLAGPFSKYSNELVNQCYENETNYLDITGENIWVRDLIDRYHKGCEDKGIFIIPSCGYDSIPSDIGSFYCHMMLNENIDHIDGYHAGKGGVSGGTIETAFNMKNYKSSYKISHPFLLNSKEFIKNNYNSKSKDKFSIKYVKDIKKYSAPFVMAIANTRVVRRTAELKQDKQTSYGPNFSYNEYMKTGSYISALMITLGLGVLGLMIISPISNLFRKLFTKPGNGPDKKTRDEGWYESIFVVKTETGNKYKFRLYGEGDPGYKSTAKLVCESALCIALNFDQIKKNSSGGVLTTASGLGKTLVNRLKKADILFEGPDKI